MRILVTGAAGFIGSHVARTLIQEGNTVYAVVREGTRKERLMDIIDRIHVVPVDLRDAAVVRSLISDIRPECAIHMAWYAVPGKYWMATDNLNCVAMTLSLAQALAEAGCRRLVAAGTCAEYDWRYGFLSEAATPCEPHTLYGIAKHGSRLMLEEFCRLSRMEFAWTRFFYVYGPGEQKERLVPSVVLSLLDDGIAKCTHGEQIRDFLHVEDAASAVCAVANSALTGPVNIGSGQPVRLRKLVETISQSLRCSGSVEFGVLSADPTEPPCLVADVRRLREGTSWEPHFTLNAGIENTVSWWQKNKQR